MRPGDGQAVFWFLVFRRSLGGIPPSKVDLFLPVSVGK